MRLGVEVGFLGAQQRAVAARERLTSDFAWPTVAEHTAEVYLSAKQAQDDLATAPLAPVPADYGLNIEPVLYVTDDAGVITARADAVVDRSEMAELIN